MNTGLSRAAWNLQICGRLLQRDLFVFKDMAVRRLINSAVWTMMIVYIYEYVGLATHAGMGVFIACGECVAWGFTGIFGNLLRFICDLQGPNTISYHFSLPVPHWMVLVTFCFSQAVQLMLVGISVIPIAMLMLGSRFPFTTFSVIKFLLIFVCAYLLYGALALLYASLIDSTEQLHTLRVRFRDMLFWLGAYFFTWHRLYSANHVVAYLDLLNPLVYACEGMRAAVAGQEGSLPFWWCCLALITFSAVTGTLAVCRMMKKLDCV